MINNHSFLLEPSDSPITDEGIIVTMTIPIPVKKLSLLSFNCL